MPPALAARQIEGYIVAEPFNAAAETLGIGKILRFTGDVWRNHACCVVFMHQHDLDGRPAGRRRWSTPSSRHSAGRGTIARRRLPCCQGRPEPLHAARAPGAAQGAGPRPCRARPLPASGAIRHAGWNDKRIDFQPYPYPSYTEELVRRLQGTLIEGNSAFPAGWTRARPRANWSMTASCAGRSQPLAAPVPSAWPRTLRAGRKSRYDGRRAVAAQRRAAPGPGGLGTLASARWWATAGAHGTSVLAARFSPGATLSSLAGLLQQPDFFQHAWASLRRVLAALAIALLAGVPAGLLVGGLQRVDAALSPAFQFLRMVSPLSWMPIVVMVLGVGDRSVLFLLAFAGVWPILLNTAAGVRQLDPRWLLLARSRPPRAPNSCAA